MNNQGEFVVETMEHCFLCLDNKSTLHQHPNEQEPIYSIQCLSRYLKMEMGKVFNAKETVPMYLLDQVQRSRLKVKLCENCVCLIQTFSKLYHQLEKIEMEVGCCIKLIHEKLASAENTDHLQNVASGCQSNNELLGKLEIANVLRKEAMEKCSSRVNSVTTPRVKIQNLTNAQANAKMMNNKFQICKTQRNVSQSSFKNFDSSESEMGYVKLENAELDMSEDVNEDCYINDDHLSDSPGVELPSSRLSILFDDVKNEETESSVDNVALARTGSGTRLPNLASRRPKSTFNPKTGKHKCSKCAKEYRDKCGVNRHIQSVHMGVVRFKCKICNKGFYQNWYFKNHLRLTTCGKGQPPTPKAIKIACSCKLCGKGFSSKRNLTRHHETIHRKLTKYACNVCNRKFTQKGSMERHRRTQHVGIKRQT